MDKIKYNLLISDTTSVTVNIERKNISNYYIKISPDLTVSVSMPLKMNIELIYNFLNSNRKWIEKNINKFKKAKEENIKDSLVNGGTIKILGAQYIVNIHKSLEDKIIVDGFYVDIYSKQHDDSSYVLKQYNNYLKIQATKFFQQVIDKYLPIFQKYNIATPTLKVKLMKSKWGSCCPGTSQITLNLYLYKASVEYINYVIFHELTHLVHTGHKKRFYNFLQKHIPNYKEIEKQLDIEASQLLF